jgi:hypothetical protein
MNDFVVSLNLDATEITFYRDIGMGRIIFKEIHLKVLSNEN